MLDLDGTFRTRPVAETLQWLLDLDVFERIGLTRVADLGRLDVTGLHVFGATRPNARYLASSQGKGVTRDLAMVSAIMEGVERWHVENLPPPAEYGSFEELKKTLPVRMLMESPPREVGAERLDDVVQGWIWAQDGLTDESILIPWSQFSIDVRLGVAPGLDPGSTNGIASGNTIEEALVHGVCEISERETERALGHLMTTAHAVELGSIGAGSLRDLVDHVRDSGGDLTLLDATSVAPGEIPTFFAFIQERDHLRGIGAVRGAGAHVSSAVAAARAITEAIQARVVMISGFRDDMPPSLYAQRAKTMAAHRVDEPVPFADAAQGERPFESRLIAGEDFASLRTTLVGRLSDAGFGPIAWIDLTRADIGVPVVGVVAQGCSMDMDLHTNSVPWSGL